MALAALTLAVAGLLSAAGTAAAQDGSSLEVGSAVDLDLLNELIDSGVSG